MLVTIYLISKKLLLLAFARQLTSNMDYTLINEYFLLFLQLVVFIFKTTAIFLNHLVIKFCACFVS